MSTASARISQTQTRLSAMLSVQNPGRNGTGMPSEPDVNPRSRLAVSSKTCENAIVASTKYGPRSRLLRNPITTPVAVATIAPTTRPIHGEIAHFVPSSAAAYAPSPKNTEWPSEIWPA